jgi:hypothetical protein
VNAFDAAKRQQFVQTLSFLAPKQLEAKRKNIIHKMAA